MVYNAENTTKSISFHAAAKQISVSHFNRCNSELYFLGLLHNSYSTSYMVHIFTHTHTHTCTRTHTHYLAHMCKQPALIMTTMLQLADQYVGKCI